MFLRGGDKAARLKLGGLQASTGGRGSARQPAGTSMQVLFESCYVDIHDCASQHDCVYEFDVEVCLRSPILTVGVSASFHLRHCGIGIAVEATSIKI